LSGSAQIPARLPKESPLLWPTLAILVIAIACFTAYWDGHRYQFPYSTAHGPLIWPPPPDAAQLATAQSSAPTVPALGNFTGLKLPGGIELKVPEFGIESKLTAFILDTSKPADKTTWFDFDRLLFDTGKATLQPASQEQLENIATILKAFPKVHARIGGYTDNTGDPAANLALSQQRATNVMAEIVSLGINPDRLDAKGYGSEHPVADNATEEGRAKNRRISLRVTEK
jgi:outer membrane protein OmpA-like peptidoglycan-associated protein